MPKGEEGRMDEEKELKKSKGELKRSGESKREQRGLKVNRERF